MNKVTKFALGVVFSSLVIGGYQTGNAMAATITTPVQMDSVQITQANYNDFLTRFDKLFGKHFFQWDYSSDVKLIQQALTYLGYKPGPADGIFGPHSSKALADFQNDHGMWVNGNFRADDFYAIRYALQLNPPNLAKPAPAVQPDSSNYISTSPTPKTAPIAQPVVNQPAPTQATPATDNPYSANSANGISQKDLDLLAHVVYSEARGESFEGQVAVAAVVLNRLKSPIFPKTIAGIVYDPWAFTSVNDGQFYLTPDTEAYQAAQAAIKGWDPTNGALYYWNPVTATSPWVWSRTVVKTIGRHIFAI